MRVRTSFKSLLSKYFFIMAVHHNFHLKAVVAFCSSIEDLHFFPYLLREIKKIIASYIHFIWDTKLGGKQTTVRYKLWIEQNCQVSVLKKKKLKKSEVWHNSICYWDCFLLKANTSWKCFTLNFVLSLLKANSRGIDAWPFVQWSIFGIPSLSQTCWTVLVLSKVRWLNAAWRHKSVMQR